MTTEILEQTGKDVGDFMKTFVEVYVKELINSKIEEVIEEVVESLNRKDDDENKVQTEEKELEETEDDDSPIIASGVTLTGYRHGIGPDKVEHRYYDVAGWCIKPRNSVISNVTYRHRKLMNFANSFKKKHKNLPNITFPQKKNFKKKDLTFYRNRFSDMLKYYDTLNVVKEASEDEEWLMFFKLKYDHETELRRELFFGALQEVCNQQNILWEYAYRRAQRLGLDMDECEMLKVVAVAKVGRQATEKLRHEIISNSPGFLPSGVKNKFMNTAEEKLAKLIASTVETAWNGALPGFKKVTTELSQGMDKLFDPLKDIILKVTEPVGELLEKKFKSSKNDEDKTNIRQIDMTKFNNVGRVLDGLKNDKDVSSLCDSLMRSICELNYTYKYITYIRYDMGNEDILDWFPQIKSITTNHNRICIAMLDCIYILGRAACRSFGPLCRYIDEASKSFDKDKHEEKLKNVVRDGGRKLAIDYFSLPYTTWRATWYCGHSVTQDVLTFCRITVFKLADLLGHVANDWNPSSKDDVKKTFLSALQPSLQEFMNERASAVCLLIRKTTITLISQLFEEVSKDSINKISDTVNKLVSKLPDPVKGLDVGKLIRTVLLKMINVISKKVVKKWAKSTEDYLFDPKQSPKECNENELKGLRVAPRVRNDDDDLGAPDDDEDEDEDDNQINNNDTNTNSINETGNKQTNDEPTETDE